MFSRLRSLLSPGASLKGRTLKGGVVALGGFGAAQGLRLLANLVMTRLLAPDAFGLMALVLSIEILIGMLSDMGLDASIVRSKKGDDPAYLATARTMQLVRASLIAVVMVAIAGALPFFSSAGAFPSGSVYADPRLPLFMAIMAMSVAVTGFSAMRVALHNRALNLVPVIRLELGAQVIAIFATVGGALAGLGAYALALGAVVAAGAKVLGSHWFLKGPPARFGFDRAHFKEIFGYGKWLVLASTLGWLSLRGDQVVFGWLFKSVEFGLYSIAVIWIFTARNVIELVQRRVAYPALAELHRERAHDLTRVYRRMRFVYEAGCLALFIAVVALADIAVEVLYTDAYAEVAHYLKLLAVSILLAPYKLLSSVLLTGGDSRRFTMVAAAPGLALLAFTPLIFNWRGADAAIVFVALTPIIAIPLNWKYAGKFVKIDHVRESAMAIAAVVAGFTLLHVA
ncbi:MAG: oligosaccharide flippase family protein [Parvularculaceae bacterium]|nr:oligosaccharide flippase family protein [Parvularculaceae bacterium]